MPALSPEARDDRRHMRRALVLARRGWGRTAPNPLVGAVLVKDGQVVGEGWHARYGEAHAEAMALAKAGRAAFGATCYVTLEPCAHTGKTPPCAWALVKAGVARVVAAIRDPNPVAAGGLEKLAAAGIAVEVGVEAEAARELNAPFLFHQRGATRPWVTLKLALSLDAAVADATRERAWITGEKARRAVHAMRAGADAVAVGIGTVLADDPELTVRMGRRPRVPPLRVVFDRGARLPLASALVKSARRKPVLLVTADPAPAAAAALERKGVAILPAADLPTALAALHGRGVRHLMVEGGASLAGAFLQAGAVDRLVTFQAPILLGAGALPAFAGAPAARIADAPRLRVVARRALGDDVQTTFALTELPA
jgi:diaminohydroxyphosphoribosylaminopyrimidine deaminase/5-amino-6-(5-phosphoribosylamino)uracil reductase